MRIFEDLNNRGRTIVIITHEPEVAARAHRRLAFKDGLLISDERDEPRQDSEQQVAV